MISLCAIDFFDQILYNRYVNVIFLNAQTGRIHSAESRIYDRSLKIDFRARLCWYITMLVRFSCANQSPKDKKGCFCFDKAYKK